MTLCGFGIVSRRSKPNVWFTVLRTGVGALFVVAIAWSTQAAEISQQQSDYWTQAFVERQFDVTLGYFSRQNTQAWPKVYSEEASVKIVGPDKTRQTRFRRMADEFLTHLYKQHKDQGHSDSTRDAYYDSLIVARDLIAKEPSYINYLLCDSINRIVFVDLAIRLTENQELSKSAVSRTRKLTAFKFDIDAVNRVLLDESPVGKIPLTTGITKVRYTKLWKALGEVDGLQWPARLGQTATEDMFEKPYLAGLMWRMAMTDYFTQSAIPAMLDYRLAGKEFGSGNVLPDMREHFKNRLRDYSSIGSTIAGNYPVDVVVTMAVDQVRSGVIYRHPLFSREFVRKQSGR